MYLIDVDVSDGKRDVEYATLMETIRRRNMSVVDLMKNESETQLLPGGYYTKFFDLIRGTYNEAFDGLRMRNIAKNSHSKTADLSILKQEFAGQI